ncbi:AraC family transcriptional regulator [Oleomonas cavernae]|uniref:AraC family transcriptional regulator n=2 Tax=Oleomonas cavernae TaxID=2320859 RepID=A0A418WA71_9PROT|nr:AraC family transcriptional regulator [Oleomonas cavernae]
MRDEGALLCLWPQRLMFIGRLGVLPPHQHPISVCLVALRRPIRVGAAGEERACRTAIVPAGLSHSLDVGGEPVAVIYNDPDRPFYRRLSPLRKNSLVSLAPAVEGAFIDAAQNLYASRQAGGGLRFDGFEAAAAQALGVEPRPLPPDARVARVISSIRADIDHNHSIEELAGKVGLSPGRLQHLFVQEIGVPLRTFRIWIRFRHAVEGVAGGASITAAALDAGFSNSSHFSHAFKATFGVTAASLFKGAARPSVVSVAA